MRLYGINAWLLSLAVQRDRFGEARLNGENFEEVKCFKYLQVDIAAFGTMKTEVSRRVGEAPGNIEKCVEREITI